MQWLPFGPMDCFLFDFDLDLLIFFCLLELDLARPSYPASAIEKIQSLLPAHAKIAEIGSGTGIMTRLLVAAGFDITAIEPVDGMRKKFGESLPDVPVIKATAWDTTLPDASQDAVIIAQVIK